MKDRTRHIECVLRYLERAQWLSPEDLKARQQHQFTTLLSHCFKNSRWWRRRFIDHGLGPDDSPECVMQRLPLLTKREVQDAGVDLFCESTPVWHGGAISVQTSGSTGEPTTIRRTRLNEIDWMAMALREHAWRRRDFSLRDCGVRGHSQVPIYMSNWGEPVRLFHSSGAAAIFPLKWRISELAAALAIFDPAYLQLFPSILKGLISEFSRTKLRPPRLQEIKTYGEALSPSLRRQAQNFFNVPVSDTYSSEEFGKIACQCPDSELLHICSELLIVEVVRDDGRPCSPGQVGRVVVTDLRNFAMPLIRYDLGDIAQVGETCKCGRASMTITRVFGRRRNLLLMPDGGRVWPRIGLITRSLKLSTTIRQVQFVQTSLQSIQIRLVVKKPLLKDDEEKIAGAVQTIFGYPFNLVFEYFPDRIPLERGSKFEDFKNLVDAY